MGAGNKFAGSALVLAAIAGFMPAAVAESTTDSRLMFDPAALDQSPAGSGPYGTPQSAPQDQAQPPSGAQAWAPPIFKLPDFEHLGKQDVAPGPALRKDDSSAAANLLDQRLSFGKLSIGLETETQLKPRSLSGDDVASERDATLDPRRQRGFLPFIGFSAKSNLQ